ncbi:MAG TPA: SRPBCC family protein [Rugosimonospora sp.]|nr:SRPBCC family protein [Rugosimonospora sp.]
MAPITTTVEVERPADKVFAYATDPTLFHEWQQGVVDGHLDRVGPPTVGALCRTTRRIGGANRTSTAKLVRLDPPAAWGVRGIDGPIRANVDVTVEPVTAHRSRLTITVDFDGHGIGKLLVPLIVRRAARNEMPSNVARLKQRIEQR